MQYANVHTTICVHSYKNKRTSVSLASPPDFWESKPPGLFDNSTFSRISAKKQTKESFFTHTGWLHKYCQVCLCAVLKRTVLQQWNLSHRVSQKSKLKIRNLHFFRAVVSVGLIEPIICFSLPLYVYHATCHMLTKPSLSFLSLTSNRRLSCVCFLTACCCKLPYWWRAVTKLPGSILSLAQAGPKYNQHTGNTHSLLSNPHCLLLGRLGNGALESLEQSTLLPDHLLSLSRLWVLALLLPLIVQLQDCWDGRCLLYCLPGPLLQLSHTHTHTHIFTSHVPHTRWKNHLRS